MPQVEKLLRNIHALRESIQIDWEGSALTLCVRLKGKKCASTWKCVSQN